MLCSYGYAGWSRRCSSFWPVPVALGWYLPPLRAYRRSMNGADAQASSVLVARGDLHGGEWSTICGQDGLEALVIDDQVTDERRDFIVAEVTGQVPAPREPGD